MTEKPNDIYRYRPTAPAVFQHAAVFSVEFAVFGMPDSIHDKLYADFRGSYEEGLKGSLRSITAREVTNDGAN